MNKIVNIATRVPIRVLNVPIRGNVRKITMSVEDIFKCICQKAEVDEVLSNGKLLRLDLANYDKVNEPVVEAKVETPVTPPAVQTPAPVVEDPKTEDPVITETAPNVEDPKTEDPVVTETTPVVEDPKTEDAPIVEEKTPAKEEQKPQQQQQRRR